VVTECAADEFSRGPNLRPDTIGADDRPVFGRVGVWHTIQGRSILRSDEVTMADVFRRRRISHRHLRQVAPRRQLPLSAAGSRLRGIAHQRRSGVSQIPDYFGNDYFNDHYLHNGAWEPQTGYCTDVWFDAATRFIEADRSRPFFCYLATNAPHDPYLVAEEFAAKFRNDPKIPNPGFCGMIEHIDGRVKKLLDTLRSLDLERDTVVIFLTDNGTAAGPISTKKGLCGADSTRECAAKRAASMTEAIARRAGSDIPREDFRPDVMSMRYAGISMCCRL